MAKSNRKKVPTAAATEVLTLSRRRCCICFCLENDSGPKADGQIAHIDRKPADSGADNLVYLCLRHHDMYDTIRRQSRGMTASEVKYYRTELYRRLGTQSPDSAKQPPVTQERIIPSQTLAQDCKTHGVQVGEVIDFVLGEATRHPMLFACAFSSIPLVFRQNILLLTWDLTCATAERLLDRKQAYPLNDLWNDCLSAYRQATILAYRQRGASVFVSDVESRRSVAVYRRLVDAARTFLSALEGTQITGASLYSSLGSLLEEAKLAFASEDLGAAIARMEALLSTVHKMILQYAPTGVPAGRAAKGPSAPQAVPVETAPEIEVPKHAQPSVLVVDDSRVWLAVLSESLSDQGYAVTTASTTTDALRALVEHEFDLVITDLVMCCTWGGTPEADGREVALAAKKSSSKTRVIVMTGYPEMSRIADLIRAGVDHVLTKDGLAKDLMNSIRRMIGRRDVAQG